MNYDTTDTDLLKSLRSSGDDVAWGRFVAQYRPAILRHCRSMGLTSDQADEVLQESLIKCSIYLPTFEYRSAVGRFRAWINLTVNQRIAELFRKSIRAERVRTAYRELLLAMEGSSAGEPAEPATFDYELLAMAFRRTQAEVDPKRWQIFEAHVVHGLGSGEVARRMGVTAISVRVTCYRIRKAVVRNWGQIQEGPF